jgi:hypothetical protein
MIWYSVSDILVALAVRAAVLSGLGAPNLEAVLREVDAT